MSNTNTRIEHDLLGDKAVPAAAYYGVQTARALENFNISGVQLLLYPNLIKALAMAARCISPPDSSRGLCRRRCPRPTRSNSSAARVRHCRRAVSQPSTEWLIICGTSTFSRAVSSGSR